MEGCCAFLVNSLSVWEVVLNALQWNMQGRLRKTAARGKWVLHVRLEVKFYDRKTKPQDVTCYILWLHFCSMQHFIFVAHHLLMEVGLKLVHSLQGKI